MAEIIEIPAQNFEALKAEVAKLNKKCEKLTGKQIHIMPIGNKEHKDPKTGYIANVLEVYVVAPEMKLSGWEFVARIDHRQYVESHRNMVFMNPTVEGVSDSKYWETPCHCDHCNEQRRRNFTFILRNENGETKQVGSSCLKDFLGHDPINILKTFELIKEAISRARSFKHNLGVNDFYYVGTVDYVANVIELLRNTKQWLGSQKAREINEQRGDNEELVEPTWSLGWSRWLNANCVNPTESQPSETSVMAAQEILNEIAQAPANNSFEENLKSVAMSRLVDSRMMTIAAVAGYKWLAKQPKEPKIDSQHFANVGDKFVDEVKVISKKLVEGYYGTSTLVRMMWNNNLLVTFASGSFNPEVDSVIRISGTVKANTEFNGVKQTNLTRVRQK